MMKQLNVVKQNKRPVLGSNPSRLKSKFVRFKKSDDGVAAIEFALIGPLFLALVFSIIDVAIFFMLERATEAGTDLVSRRVKTHMIAIGTSSNDFRQQLCEAPSMAMFNCNDIHVDVSVIGNFGAPGDTPRMPDGSLDSAGFSVTIGQSQQIHIVRVYIPWPSVLPWGKMFEFYGSGPDARVDSKRVISAATAFLKE